MVALKSFSAQGGQGPPCENPLKEMGSEGHLSLRDDVFRLFQNLIYNTAGIRLGSQKKGLLASRLLRRLKKTGIDSFQEYYRKVKEDSDELVEMLNCISTNTTHFFRENHHFEYFKNKVIPELLRIKSSEKTIRIWSAGCSTGEEPYSIAISICEALNDMRGWDIKVLATDISTKVLDAAKNGIYEYEAVSDTSDSIVRRYFLKGSGENVGKIKVRDFLKDIVKFRRLNLKDEAYPFKKGVDVIFCRNVMIYFDENMKQHVITMFHKHLSENGHLFLGHSETMFGGNGFKPVFITVYKKQ